MQATMAPMQTATRTIEGGRIIEGGSRHGGDVSGRDVQATSCPECGGELYSVYEAFGRFMECESAGCFFTARATDWEAAQ